MKYQNAAGILPEKLLAEIQKYVHGEFVYIPNPEGIRKRWGENSGSRQLLRQRNTEIRERFSKGETITGLSDQFCLSYDSIKKIIYTK
ncbi:hypothetical protein BVG16_10660 [Paenibacillus selenitireducens]|uniref:Mor transcription activator domain-containing protein n=1 Tax=Paenibacillus selenitireducens TaxID=1324314 RepID=A0A1T2XFZ1_9BACL|nr:CD3324 family protein [Paenibacillus selenitireducens]OPA78758.1 hypothetical protein BVG16_10660 [Paenibacillus selenitireducens]